MYNSQIPSHQAPHYPMSVSQQLIPNSYYGQPYQPQVDYQKQSQIERIPYEKKTIDYYPQEKIEYIPQEQKYQDFLDVQHELDYIPVPRLEKYTEQVPLERYDTYYDYMPRQNTVVRSTGTNYIPPANQQYSQSYQYGPRYGSAYGPRYGSSYGVPAYQGPVHAPMGNFSAVGSYAPGYQARPFSQGRPPMNYPMASPYSGYSRYRYP